MSVIARSITASSTPSVSSFCSSDFKPLSAHSRLESLWTIVTTLRQVDREFVRPLQPKNVSVGVQPPWSRCSGYVDTRGWNPLLKVHARTNLILKRRRSEVEVKLRRKWTRFRRSVLESVKIVKEADIYFWSPVNLSCGNYDFIQEERE